MKKVLTIIGARPQFIKAAAVSRALAGRGLKETIVHTGQHFDSNMSEVFFDELEIPRPAANLGIGGGTHGQNTGRMIEAIEKVLVDLRPDWVLVYGDTDSTLSGALAAVKLHIPVAHVEAGLRSFNRKMPEEINRVVCDHVSSVLFAPTELAVSHLASEGIAGDCVHCVGDVMFDAALYFAEKAEKSSEVLGICSLVSKSYVLATVHRAENTDDALRLSAIFEGLGAVDSEVVLPLHPRTRRKLSEFQVSIPRNVKLIEPVGYLDMVMLEKQAAVIATDSGGVQKEAFFYGVPCVTLRDETEWRELVDAGWNRVVSPQSGEVIAAAIKGSRDSRGRDIRPYGDGHAGEAIALGLAGR